MKKTKVCLICKKVFVCYHDGKYCSRDCYWKGRWGEDKKCKNCGKLAKFRYCSKKCIKEYWDKNSYRCHKKHKMAQKKNEIIKTLGGKCVKCGNDDVRVLDIHHKNGKLKKRPPKLHYTMWNRLKEWEENMGNLELLCANCHRIHTWAERRIHNEAGLF